MAKYRAGRNLDSVNSPELHRGSRNDSTIDPSEIIAVRSMRELASVANRESRSLYITVVHIQGTGEMEAVSSWRY